MKIVIGVDTAGQYRSTLNLAARLKFESPTWSLAHSVDLSTSMSGGALVGDGGYGIEFARLSNEVGEQALEEAREDACAHGLKAETIMLAGNAAAALAMYADEVHADLVGVHSQRKGTLGSLFLGSVSRGLAIGSTRSVLISKGPVAPTGPLTLVFATDHSDYATKALDQLIAMKPKGVVGIKVVFALHLDEVVEEPHPGLREVHLSMVGHLRQEGERKTKECVARLQAAGFAASGEVVNAPVNEAIGQVMAETLADLLVIGAQGHGFMHRLVLGSTSLHQVVAEPHPVLILRH